MTPLSLHELETEAFRRALAAALGVRRTGEPPWPAERRAPAAWDPLGSVEVEEDPHADADVAPERRAA